MGLSCRPCSKIGYAKMSKETFPVYDRPGLFMEFAMRVSEVLGQA
jgi:hypothetical protein